MVLVVGILRHYSIRNKLQPLAVMSFQDLRFKKRGRGRGRLFSLPRNKSVGLHGPPLSLSLSLSLSGVRKPAESTVLQQGKFFILAYFPFFALPEV